jgi:hypothetical protein
MSFYHRRFLYGAHPGNLTYHFLFPFESSALLHMTSVGLASISWFTTERTAVFCVLI